jgi:hypothetical protein
MSAVDVIVSLERLRRSRVALLATRLEVASTMLSMAESAIDWPRARHLEAIARGAYERVALDFLSVRFVPDEITVFADKVESLSKRFHIFACGAPLRERVAARDARVRLLAHRWRIDINDSPEAKPPQTPSERPPQSEQRWRTLPAATYSRRVH